VILFLVDLLQWRMTELFKVPYTDILKHQPRKYESNIIMLRHWKVMLVGIHTHHLLAPNSTNNSDLDLFPEKRNMSHEKNKNLLLSMILAVLIGILIMAYFNPHITGSDFIPFFHPKQRRFFSLLTSQSYCSSCGSISLVVSFVDPIISVSHCR